MAIYTLTPQQLKGAGIYNSFEIPAGGGVPSFTNTKSILLDGVDDYVTMGNVSNLNFQRTDAFSISTWVKRGSFTETQILFSKMNSSGNYRGYMFYIAAGSDAPQFLLRRDTSFTSQRLLVIGSTAILDNNWHHLVVTYDGSSTASGVKIYVDEISDTTTFTGAISDSITTPAPVNIGARNNNDYFNDFSCDEVSVFNTELSQSDITSIYNGGVPNDISSLSPISWWRCGDGDTSPTLTDNGSGGNNGTMTNFTTFSTDVPT
jgi:hypothetical protein